MLDSGAHERVEQLVQYDLARNGLRHLEHGREIQMFDRRPDRARRPDYRLFLAQLGMELIKLPHLPIGAPAQVATPGVSQKRVSHRRKAARRTKPCGAFVGQGLVLDETIRTRQSDGLFIEVYRVQVPAFEPCNLGAYQCLAVRESCGTVLCPDRELLV